MNPKFIVTGGAGFIGSNLVKSLNRRGWTDIIVVDHLTDDFKRKNLAELSFREYVDKSEFRTRLRSRSVGPVDGVFHLGACSSTTETDETYLHDNNYLYSRELCEWSFANNARFVYASSAATYGDGSHGYSDDEKRLRELQPLNLYGKSKQEFDLWARDTGALKNIAGLKYFNVYGPGEDHKGEMRSLVNKAYDQVMRDGEITLFRSHKPEYRDGEQTRDFIYVEDAVNQTLFFFDHPQVSGLYNCGTGVARTWLDLARALFAAMERVPRIRFVDIPESIRERYQYHTQSDLSKLRSAGYTESFLSIEEGVGRYVVEYLKKR